MMGRAMMAETGALAGLRVLDLSDECGRLAGRLLAEAGAAVVRLRRGEPGPPMAADITAGRGGLLHWWFDGGVALLPLDLETDEGRRQFRALAARADLLIETEPPGRLAALDLDHPTLASCNPRLVQVSLTPFGREGPRAGWLASDLVSAALGGMLSVTGDPDAPLNGWGRQTGTVGSLYAAVCGLAGVLAARASGRGAHIDLSLHEAVITCTEQVLMYWFFQSRLPRAIAQRQRALHWSGLYDVIACRDGHVMVTPASDLPGQLAWLAEDGVRGFEDPTQFVGPSAASYIPAFMAAVRAWAVTKEAAAFFEEGQRRGLPYGLVQGVAEAAESPQLAARGSFRPVTWDGPPVRLPGPLVRLSETPAPPPAPPPIAPLTAEEALAAWPARDEQPAAQVPEPNGAPAAQPLAGLRVLDFTWVLAGPFATRLLAELGADVIKVQTETRSQGAHGNEHPYFMMWNRGKRSAALDMKHPRAQEVFRRLVERADVLIENFSAGVLDRWGIGYETLCAWNERLIYVGMSGFGVTGPWRDFVSYAPTIHALCGLTALTNRPGERDCGFGFSYNDHASGLAGALAVLEALHARGRTGRGQFVDLSQLEVGVYLAGPSFLDYLANGREAVATGNRDAFADYVPNEVYRCGDGGWLALTARDDGEWRRLAAVVGDPVLADPLLATVEQRRARRAEIDPRLSAWAETQRAEAVMRRLQAAGVPAGVVQTAAEMAGDDEQLAARDWRTRVPHPVHGTIEIDRFPARFDGLPPPPPAAAPLFGEHTFAVYAELAGMTDEEIAAGIGEGLFA
jgi:crotonobetainyl-CoA:carnitine CoA-transferase CaiB-like acyl-CoA transferase